MPLFSEIAHESGTWKCAAFAQSRDIDYLGKSHEMCSDFYIEFALWRPI